jgi:HSP20 family protein
MTTRCKLPSLFRGLPSTFKNDFIAPFSNLADEFFKTEFPELSKEFGDFFSKGSYPKVNVINLKDKVIIKAAIPGLEKKDIKITVKNNVLTISGNKIQEDEVKDSLYICRELKQSQFSRSFELYDNLVLEKIKAKVENGLLNIEIPKKEIEVVANTEDYKEIPIE